MLIPADEADTKPDLMAMLQEAEVSDKEFRAALIREAAANREFRLSLLRSLEGITAYIRKHDGLSTR